MIQIFQALKTDDRLLHISFATKIQNQIDEDSDYMQCVCITYDATFHILW